MAERGVRITARWLLRGGIAELGLGQSEALVLLALVDHAEGDISWIPQTHLRNHLGMARSTVQSAEDALRDRGLIIAHEPGRQGRTTRWRIARRTLSHAR